MYCLLNNLAFPEQRALADKAVRAGIGEQSGAVDHYKIVANPDSGFWELTIVFKKDFEREPVVIDVDPDNQSAREIERLVKDALMTNSGP